MDKVELQRLLARNVEQAISRKFSHGASQEAIAKAANLSQKTISNILSASTKSDEEVADLPSTSIVKLAALAETLDIPVWALLHPDPRRAAKLDEVYKEFEQEVRESSGTVDKFGTLTIRNYPESKEKLKQLK